jgi:hypothetical protein
VLFASRDELIGDVIQICADALRLRTYSQDIIADVEDDQGKRGHVSNLRFATARLTHLAALGSRSI